MRFDAADVLVPTADPSSTISTRQTSSDFSVNSLLTPSPPPSQQQQQQQLLRQQLSPHLPPTTGPASPGTSAIKFCFVTVFNKLDRLSMSNTYSLV
jgi:hypothetical protein